MILFPIASGVGLVIVALHHLATGQVVAGAFILMGAFWAFACALDPARSRATRGMETARILAVLLSDTPGLGGYPLSRLANVTPGRLYVHLDRLEDDGWIVGEWEAPEPLDRPRRRFYRLTPEGRTYALNLLAEQSGKKS